jgi:hypothetical protein
METPTTTIEGAQTLLAERTYVLVEALPFVSGGTVLSPAGDEYIYHGIVTFSDGYTKHAFSRKSGSVATNNYVLLSTAENKLLDGWRAQLSASAKRWPNAFKTIVPTILSYYEDQPRTTMQLQVASFLRKKITQELCLQGPKPPTRQEYKELVQLLWDIPMLTGFFTELHCIEGWSEHTTSILLLHESEDRDA